MPRFRFTAMDGSGAETDDMIEAESRSQAVQMIRSKGLFPTRIVEADAQRRKGGASGAKAGGKLANRQLRLPRMFGGRVKPKQLMTFTRQLATLIEAGLPLLRGLRILLKQEKKPALREALAGMGEAVEGGSTFSEALAQYPRIFDNLFVNMVRAGEAGGVLEQVLVRLAEFMEKAERIKNKVKSAMVYPIVVLIAAMCILTFLMIFIIPKFNDIFKDLLGGKALPPLTQFVIAVSNLFAHRWYLIIGTIVGLFVALRLIRRTEWGGATLDRLKLRMPLFGTLFRKSAIARFSRTLGTLMGAGVPVLQALNIVRDTSGNRVVATAIQRVHDSVKEGDSMAMPMEASGVFPDMVVSMVDVGEETGALPEMLVRVAANYDDDVDTTVEGLTSVIEPIMIILLALIIGTIVIAMFVPLISIISEMAA
jgi:type IV pilus assembly protein PilC